MNNGLSYNQWKELTAGKGGKLLNDLLVQWELVFTNVFKWNTESTGNVELGRYIERYLYGLGTAVFFKDGKGVYGVLPFATSGGINWYGEMTKWKVIGANGYMQNFNIMNSVRMRNNALSMSYLSYVHKQLLRLVNIEGTIDVNMNQLKVPMIFSGNENSLLTMKNLYKKIASNEPVIYTDKKIDIQSDFKGVSTGVQYYGEQLNTLYNDIEGRLLKIAGLKYVHTEKKERLVVDEVNSNDGLSNTFLQSALEERQLACKLINEMFGLTISVDVNPFLKLSDPNKDDSNNEDGEVDE